MIGKLTGLMQLDLWNNELTTLPATCTMLTGLVDLNLGGKLRLRGVLVLCVECCGGVRRLEEEWLWVLGG